MSEWPGGHRAVKAHVNEWLISTAGVAILLASVAVGIRLDVEWIIWTGAALGLAIAMLPIIK
jgi:hypothetical protein